MTEDQSPPDPPGDLPAYVTDPLERQSLDRLEQIRQYVETLLAHRRAQAQRDLEADDVAHPDEEVLDIDERSSGPTRVVKRIPCGKDTCSTCPHGPYLYHVHRDGDSLVWEYQGPADVD
jgi:hypothetical protein